MLLTLGACAARVTVVVVCVCLSVCLLFDNSLHEWLFASKTNTHIQRRMEVKKYVWVFSETAAFESDGVKHERKSQYANKHVHFASGYCWY